MGVWLWDEDITWYLPNSMRYIAFFFKLWGQGSLFQSLAFKGSPPPASGPCLVQDADLTDVHQNGWFLDGIRGHSCNTPHSKTHGCPYLASSPMFHGWEVVYIQIFWVLTHLCRVKSPQSYDTLAKRVPLQWELPSGNLTSPRDMTRL